MRLDANKNPAHVFYSVFDCDVMKFRTDVVWVDDEQEAYGVYANRGTLQQHLVEHSAKIQIMPAQKLVFINPKLEKGELLASIVNEEPVTC